MYTYIFFSFFFKAAPAAHGSSQARGQTGAAMENLHHSHSNAKSELHYAAACGNATSLNH